MSAARGREARWGWLCLAVILAVHLWATTWVIDPATLFSSEPFYGDDHALHFARAAVVAAELPRTGRLWVYDPTIMAGYPLGATVFDLDNVGTAVLMALLRPLGAPIAYKLVVWLCLAVAPVAVWASARRLGCSTEEAAAGAAAATVIAATAITFRIGLYANFAACYLAVLLVVLAGRHFGEPSWGSFVALVAVAAGGMLMHVLVPVLALVPCAILVLGHAWRTPRRTLRDATAAALAVLAFNAAWLVPYVRFAPYLGTDYPSPFFQTGALGAAWATLTVVQGWHLFLLGLGGVGLVVVGRRRGGLLAAAFAVWVGLLLLVGLQGSRISWLARLQPARFVQPLAFALAPLAGVGAATLVRRSLGAVGVSSGLTLVLAPLVFAPYLVLALRTVAPLPALAAGLPAEGYAFIDWLREHTGPLARVLVEDRLHLEAPRRDRAVPDHPYFGSHLPALLPDLVRRETIGGPYPEMPIRPHRADLSSGVFFGSPLAAWPRERFAAQLELYNVGWIVVWSEAARRYLGDQRDVVEPVAELGHFALFRSRQRPSFFLVGSGEVRARHDALEVHDASPGRVVLKYHWYPGFCSDPPLPVAAYEAPDLAMPFIAVENGSVRRFTLRPTTGWLGRCG